MEESGQRSTHIKIIDNPGLRSPIRIFSEGFSTLVCWGVFACLAAPVVSLIMKIFDIHIPFSGIDSQSGINDNLVFMCYFLGFQPKIIDRPVLKSPLRYLFEGSFTLALWALWVYWLMPIFTLLLWIFGFHLYYSENLIGGGMEELLNTFKNGGLAVLVIACVMLGWTYYNYLWFLRRGERRNKSEAIIFDGDIARYFNVNLGHLRCVRIQSIINISIDNDQIILPVAHNKKAYRLKAI